MCVSAYLRSVLASPQTDITQQPQVQYSTPHSLSLKGTLLLRTIQTHKETYAHSTQWLLFIVHSFMLRASCLAWYSIIFQPTLSFPAIPGGGSSTASPQLWLCNTVVSFRPKALLLWANSQPACVTSADRAARCKLNFIVALKSYTHPTLRAALLQRHEF